MGMYALTSTPHPCCHKQLNLKKKHLSRSSPQVTGHAKNFGELNTYNRNTHLVALPKKEQNEQNTCPIKQ